MVKIGDALKRAVEDKPPETEQDLKKRRQASALLNDNRRDIFQMLCVMPCSSISRISSELPISRPTIVWHLDALEKAGYVERKDYFGKTIFYPSGMLKMDDSKKILSLLNERFFNEIFKQILKEPGSSTGALIEAFGNRGSMRGALAKLEVCGLITVLKDGRHLRYYPTDRLIQLAKLEKSTLKKFRASLIKRMEKEYLAPEINEIKGSGMAITLSFGKNKVKMEIPYYLMEKVLA